VSALRVYKVFISHAWAYNEDYHRVVTFLDSQARFEWENLSVPDHDPVDHADVETLEYELRNQMRPADVFLILAGMYAAFSGWVDFEVTFARRIGTPIVGVLPYGSQRVPLLIQNAATELVGWNTHSIVDAIRRRARRQ
jgi:hypothetical protein